MATGAHCDEREARSTTAPSVGAKMPAVGCIPIVCDDSVPGMVESVTWYQYFVPGAELLSTNRRPCPW